MIFDHTHILFVGQPYPPPSHADRLWATTLLAWMMSAAPYSSNNCSAHWTFNSLTVKHMFIATGNIGFRLERYTLL
jgi:hypothetical protein